jgi:riboflavin biosynthesis pyrimidine reductase
MTERPELHRILPSPAVEISVREAYTVERLPHADRPWIGLCMVSSLDGSISVDGASGRLGNPNDLDVLLTLRSIADMILVGAGTARGEGYGAPKKVGQRIGVVTNSAAVDLETELFTSGAGFLITHDAADVDDSRVQVIRAGRDHVDIAEAVTRLAEIDPDVTYVQAEGGAGFNGSLFGHDLIDELDLSLSPHLVGGRGPRVTSGADEHLRRFELAHLLVDSEGFVFSRWTRAC